MRAERKKQAPPLSRQSNGRLKSRTLGSCPEPKAAAQPLSPPGAPLSTSEADSAELTKCCPFAPHALIVTAITVSTYKKCAPSPQRPGVGV